MESALIKLEKGDVENAYKDFKSLTGNDLQPQEYTRIQWIEDFSERQKDRKYNCMNCGIRVSPLTCYRYDIFVFCTKECSDEYGGGGDK